MANATEKTHNWTDEETQALITWRGTNDRYFTGKKNTFKSGWEEFVKTSGLSMTGKQAGKKWNNLKDRYKEHKDPPTGKGVEPGGATAATWKWYSQMDAALGGQHSINAPLVVASNITATSGGVVRLATSSLSETEEARESQPEKKKKKNENLLDFLQEQSEREEERHREDLRREEERERAAAQRSERYLALFEKLVDKM